ncbi:MAG: SDR family oxidoreductase [Acidobacteriota bacterium]
MPRNEPSVPEEISPSRYIEKVSLMTGEVQDEEFSPHRLLVNSHRDYHVVDMQARRFMSRVVAATGDEDRARRRMKEVRRLGHKTAQMLAKVTRQDPEKIASALFGLKDREYFFRYKRHPHTREEIDQTLERLRGEAEARLTAATGPEGKGLRVLLTGGTGFVGQEILWQASHNDAVRELVVVIRPKEIRDRKTKEVVRTLSPAERGETLLDRLWLTEPEQRQKFRFVAGDVEQPNLGISDEDLEELTRTITHVIHCAASVAFDDPYEKSFRANVTGTLNALRFSHALQSAPDSRFIAHLGIETSYIHGRQTSDVAREDEIIFPRNFYNNYYELTKAIASIETERFMLDKGLRVVQLNPAIVIGESRAGNNRGDTKVVNAPVNAFGRAHQALTVPKEDQKWFDRSTASVIAKMACIFPGDPTAEINLIPVDRVVEGILAALTKPSAVGERVHLATDNRLTSEQIQKTVKEELGVEVTLADPTLHRNITLPVLTRLLKGIKQPKLAHALDKLGTIFGGYSEWGQPIHEVGNDVRVLGLSQERPNTRHAFRMLCRHNRYVQNYGQVRDADEISRREKVWWDFILELEEETGRPAGAMSAEEFRTAVEERLDLATFERRKEVPPS